MKTSKAPQRSRLRGRALLSSVALGVMAIRCVPVLDELEVARRVAESRPTWPNYQEDIKAQIGAGPVAEWEGRLESVEANTGRVVVRFVVRGPWSTRDCAIPILLQEPLGGVHQSEDARRDGTQVTYTFRLAESDAPVPWIALRFPHATRRIAIPSTGVWKSTLDS